MRGLEGIAAVAQVGENCGPSMTGVKSLPMG
jgi:hypothetical protein